VSSPIVWYDGAAAPQSSTVEYQPTTLPGSRAPHAWLSDGRSTIDLFGNGFTLLRLGASAPQPSSIERAAAQRGVPLHNIGIADPAIATPYERPLVLVRPDGHVAWRGTHEPADSLAVIDYVRGAGAAE
jgi:hypothetical protein